MLLIRVAVAALSVCLLPGDAISEESGPQLAPGSTLSVQFPEMPPTYWAMANRKNDPAQLSLCCQTTTRQKASSRYSSSFRAAAAAMAVRRRLCQALTEDRDFICAHHAPV